MLTWLLNLAPVFHLCLSHQIKISLYGEAEVTYTVDMPGMKCDDMGCNIMGSKVIAVLGKLWTDYLPA